MFKKILFFSAQFVIYFFFISVLSSRLNINVQRGPGSWQLTNEGSAAFTKSFAASHLYLGLSVTKGQSFFYNGPGQPPRPYLHQPPGMGLTVWIIEHFFGYQGELEQFWPLFLPLVPQTISFILIAVITVIITGSLFLSVCATLIFTLLPISIYFGHITESMIVTLPFVLISLIAYYYYLQKNQLKYFLLLLISTSLSAFYCWTGVFILPVMAIHMLIYSKFKPNKTQMKFIIGSALWEGLIIFLLFGQIYWADNFSFNALKDGYDRRLLGYTYNKIGVFEFINICLNYIKNLYTLPICLSAFIFSLVNIIKILSYKKISISSQIVFISLFIGLGPVLSIPYVSTEHGFWYFILIPFFLFSTIMVLKYFYKKLSNKKILFYTIAIAFILALFLSGKDLIYNYYTGGYKYPPVPGHFVEIFNIWGRRQ